MIHVSTRAWVEHILTTAIKLEESTRWLGFDARGFLEKDLLAAMQKNTLDGWYACLQQYGNMVHVADRRRQSVLVEQQASANERGVDPLFTEP